MAKTLGVAPPTYHAAKSRPPSARSIRDAELKPEILRVWEQNLSVYDADKVWDQLNKDGIRVARCTVERLMADLGLQGCRRGRVFVRTTEADETLERRLIWCNGTSEPRDCRFLCVSLYDLAVTGDG